MLCYIEGTAETVPENTRKRDPLKVLVFKDADQAGSKQGF